MDRGAEPAGASPGAWLLARAGWLDVLDEIHGGICHDLNSRVASLDGLIQIVELDPDRAGESLAYLAPEAERLAATARLLGLLGGRPDAPPETFLPGDLAADALALVGRARGLEDMDSTARASDGTPPVRACRPRVLRVLLCVLHAAGRAAREAGAPGLAIHASGTDRGMSLRVAWAPGAATAWNAAADLGDAVAPLAAALALDGGDLRVGAEGSDLMLPALRRG